MNASQSKALIIAARKAAVCLASMPLPRAPITTLAFAHPYCALAVYTAIVWILCGIASRA